MLIAKRQISVLGKTFQQGESVDGLPNYWQKKLVKDGLAVKAAAGGVVNVTNKKKGRPAEGTGEGAGEGTGEGAGEGTGEGAGEGTGEGAGEAKG